jgi:hypothetical protein
VPLSTGEYLIFGLLTVFASVGGVVMWMVNPLAWFLHATAPLVRLLGRDARADGWGSFHPRLVVFFLWPLTLAPLHYLNFHVLEWPAAGYLGLALTCGLAISFGALFIASDRRG